jgi:hypothetical protein
MAVGVDWLKRGMLCVLAYAVVQCTVFLKYGETSLARWHMHCYVASAAIRCRRLMFRIYHNKRPRGSRFENDVNFTNQYEGSASQHPAYHKALNDDHSMFIASLVRLDFNGASGTVLYAGIRVHCRFEATSQVYDGLRRC